MFSDPTAENRFGRAGVQRSGVVRQRLVVASHRFRRKAWCQSSRFSAERADRPARRRPSDTEFDGANNPYSYTERKRIRKTSASARAC